MKLLKMIHTSFLVPTSYTDAALSLLMHVWVLKSMVLFLLKKKGYGKSSASQVFERRNVVFILKISSLHKGVPVEFMWHHLYTFTNTVGFFFIGQHFCIISKFTIHYMFCVLYTCSCLAGGGGLLQPCFHSAAFKLWLSDNLNNVLLV